MFSITDNERLRDAYALLMFMPPKERHGWPSSWR